MWSGDGFNPAMQPNLFLSPGQGGLLLPPYAPPVAGSPSAFGAPGFYYGMPPISELLTLLSVALSVSAHGSPQILQVHGSPLG